MGTLVRNTHPGGIELATRKRDARTWSEFIEKRSGVSMAAVFEKSSPTASEVDDHSTISKSSIFFGPHGLSKYGSHIRLV